MIGVLSLKGRMRERFREDEATSTDPRQKHTVGTIDEDIIRRIDTQSFRVWECGIETEVGWRHPFITIEAYPLSMIVRSDCAILIVVLRCTVR